jgi:hypothetical protein
MTVESLVSGTTRDLSASRVFGRSGLGLIRSAVIACGVGWAVLFIYVGLRYRLQLYGDGSVFSYGVAVQDAWTVHWHNISGRLSVYLICFLPAEAFVALTGNAAGGIAVYGFLFFAAQLAGLIATFASDRSKGQVIFCFACFSTACVCPLVFGFPTEMWMTHALFWPALAMCHFARRGVVANVIVFTLLLALALTHEGALILIGAILLTVLPRGVRDAAFIRTAASCGAVLAIWFAVKAAFRPDPYIAAVLDNAEWHFFDVKIFTCGLLLVLAGALAGYGVALVALRRLLPVRAELFAVAIAGVALGVYWLWFDRSLHTENRYFLRTVVLLATTGLGVVAAACLLAAEGRLDRLSPALPGLIDSVADLGFVRAIAGAAALVMLVHAVETDKFVTAWTDYKAAVRRLAMGSASDPALGDRSFVSAVRVGASLNRLSWSSTTPYLSVLLAPRLTPARLVVDPDANYFWLSCQAAKANEAAERAVPVASRRLIRTLECMHRR